MRGRARMALSTWRATSSNGPTMCIMQIIIQRARPRNLQVHPTEPFTSGQGSASDHSGVLNMMTVSPDSLQSAFTVRVVAIETTLTNRDVAPGFRKERSTSSSIISFDGSLVASHAGGLSSARAADDERARER